MLDGRDVTAQRDPPGDDLARLCRSQGVDERVALPQRIDESCIGAVADETFNCEPVLRDRLPEEPFRLAFQGKTFQAVLTFPERRAGRCWPRECFTGWAQRSSMSTVGQSRRSEMTENALRMDPIISQALYRAQRLLEVGLPLIIIGETGSGKTTFAETLASRCFGADVIVVDCAAPADVATIGSAFTSCAARDRVCIVLERFDEASRDVQNCLLNFLKYDRCLSFGRIGIIATSATGLDQMNAGGQIRSDLLYRLKGGSISLQPLRNNPDMGGTIHDLLKIEQDALGRPDLKLSANAYLVLANYHWPGNLRELRKALRHAVALSEGAVIGMEHLPQDIVGEIARKDLTAKSLSEASRIEAALRYNRGNVSLTARYLGISRATLYRKIEIRKTRDAESSASDPHCSPTDVVPHESGDAADAQLHLVQRVKSERLVESTVVRQC
jgi:transcriptional regulator of acetoin/glycerol metabolism